MTGQYSFETLKPGYRRMAILGKEGLVSLYVFVDSEPDRRRGSDG